MKFKNKIELDLKLNKETQIENELKSNWKNLRRKMKVLKDKNYKEMS